MSFTKDVQYQGTCVLPELFFIQKEDIKYFFFVHIWFKVDYNDIFVRYLFTLKRLIVIKLTVV